MTSLRIAIVTGEASGDILGAGLMTAIQKSYPHAQFFGIGGPRMLALGFHSLFDQERLAVMGLVEPLKRLPELLSIRRQLKAYCLAERPDVFIGIDSPDFNLALEQAVKAAGITTVHYVSPSVWAWRQGRIKIIRKAVDLMLTLLPFEADFYRQHQVPVTFVGHPLADDIPLSIDVGAARDSLGLDRKGHYVALMPGSRGGEVSLMGPVLLEAARLYRQRFADVQFLLPAANAQRRAQLETQLLLFNDLPITLFEGNSHTVMAAADSVAMTSGTTALEALLLKKPMVVAYKMAPLSYWIISRMVKSRFISLPNLLADEALVPELLQSEATPEAIAAELCCYREQPQVSHNLTERFYHIHHQLRQSASDTAAKAVLQLIPAANVNTTHSTSAEME